MPGCVEIVEKVSFERVIFLKKNKAPETCYYYRGARSTEGYIHNRSCKIRRKEIRISRKKSVQKRNCYHSTLGSCATNNVYIVTTKQTHLLIFYLLELVPQTCSEDSDVVSVGDAW